MSRTFVIALRDAEAFKPFTNGERPMWALPIVSKLPFLTSLFDIALNLQRPGDKTFFITKTGQEKKVLAEIEGYYGTDAMSVSVMPSFAEPGCVTDLAHISEISDGTVILLETSCIFKNENIFSASLGAAIKVVEENPCKIASVMGKAEVISTDNAYFCEIDGVLIGGDLESSAILSDTQPFFLGYHVFDSKKFMEKIGISVFEKGFFADTFLKKFAKKEDIEPIETVAENFKQTNHLSTLLNSCGFSEHVETLVNEKGGKVILEKGDVVDFMPFMDIKPGAYLLLSGQNFKIVGRHAVG